MPSLSMKVFLRSPGFMLSSFYWKGLKQRGADHWPRRPSGTRLLGNLEGSRTALLLRLDADNLAVLDEHTESRAHLLSRDTELSGHLLVGNGNVLLLQLGEDVRTELLSLEVHLGLARTSSVTSELVELLLAEGHNLLIVVHLGHNAVVEVLLGGLDLGHDFLLSGTRVPVLGTSPFDSFFSEEVVLFFPFVIYIIPYFYLFCQLFSFGFSYFLFDLLSLLDLTAHLCFPSLSFSLIIL